MKATLKNLSKSCLVLATLAASSAAMSEPGNWVRWQEGMFQGNSQSMTCVADDSSEGAPKFSAQGQGEDAALNAYQQCLDYVNVANRNPAYIEVFCGW